MALDVIRYDGSVRQSAGGTAANVAANLAHLGWTSQLVGRIGDDAQARRILSDLRTAGVGIDLLVPDPSIETPVVVHEVLPPRHRFDLSCPECGRASPRYRPPSSELFDEAFPADAIRPGHDVVFVDRASAFSVELLARAAERGALTVFEPSSRGTEAASRAAAGHAAILRWSAETRPRLHPSTLAARDGQLQIESVSAAACAGGWAGGLAGTGAGGDRAGRRCWCRGLADCGSSGRAPEPRARLARRGRHRHRFRGRTGARRARACTWGLGSGRGPDGRDPRCRSATTQGPGCSATSPGRRSPLAGQKCLSGLPRPGLKPDCRTFRPNPLHSRGAAAGRRRGAAKHPPSAMPTITASVRLPVYIRALTGRAEVAELLRTLAAGGLGSAL